MGRQLGAESQKEMGTVGTCHATLGKGTRGWSSHTTKASPPVMRCSPGVTAAAMSSQAGPGSPPSRSRSHLLWRLSLELAQGRQSHCSISLKLRDRGPWSLTKRCSSGLCGQQVVSCGLPRPRLLRNCEGRNSYGLISAGGGESGPSGSSHFPESLGRGSTLQPKRRNHWPEPMGGVKLPPLTPAGASGAPPTL